MLKSIGLFAAAHVEKERREADTCPPIHQVEATSGGTVDDVLTTW